MAPVVAREADSHARLEYQPALDGVRAIAVAMVLVFHAGFGWMRAGYLGVSIFFTLSGFLITSVLLKESDRSGQADLGRFYARRLRRLLPASIICLTFIGIAYVSGEFAFVPRFRGQMLGAVLNVYNWVQIGSGSTYEDIFATAPALTSPLEHYWSLAIEEQFYLIWPVVLLLIVRRAAGRRSTAIVISGLFALFALSSPLLAARFGSDFAYWSTPTRFSEILAGAALAAIVIARGHIPAWVGHLALPMLAGLVALAVLLPSASGPAYTGWMGAIAIVSGLLILGLQGPSLVRRALSVIPLVALGKISYGIYLFHWPVFVLYRQHGWDLTNPAGFVVAVGTTLAIAAASYFLVEQVIRSASWPNPRTLVASGALLGVSVAAILVMPVSRGFLEPNREVLESAAIDPDEDVVKLLGASPETSITALAPASSSPSADLRAQSTSTNPPAPTTVPVPTTVPPSAMPLIVTLPETPNRPVRLLTVGDSTAFSIGQALAEWSVENSEFASASVLWCPGCGFILTGTVSSWDASETLGRSREIMRDELPYEVNSLTPDVVMLMSSIDDLTNRIWTEEEGVLTPYDDKYQQRMNDEYDQLTRLLIELGVPNIVWIAPPVPEKSWASPEMAEAARWDVLHEVLLSLEADYAGTVTVIDLEKWMNQTGHTTDETWRPDGVHLAEEPALELADDFLGPLLVRIALGLPVS